MAETFKVVVLGTYFARPSPAFVAATLDRLLAHRLPALELRHTADETGRHAAAWAEAHGLPHAEITEAVPILDREVERACAQADGVVVFGDTKRRHCVTREHQAAYSARVDGVPVKWVLTECVGGGRR